RPEPHPRGSGPRWGVAADVQRSLAPPTGALLVRGHVRGRLGRGAGALPSVGRQGRLEGRVQRPDVGDAGGAGDLARLRTGGRLSPGPHLPPGPVGRGAGTGRRRVADRADSGGRLLGSGRLLAAGCTWGRRPAGRQDPGGRRRRGSGRPPSAVLAGRPGRDRKSTRLNSSHVKTSYAVF